MLIKLSTITRLKNQVEIFTSYNMHRKKFFKNKNK